MEQSPLKSKNDNVSLVDKVISTSALKEAKKSTRDFVYYYEKKKTSGKHFDFGNAMELFLLDKKEFKKKVAVFDESDLLRKVIEDNPKSVSPRATNIYKNGYVEFLSNNTGKYIINKFGEDSMEVIEAVEKLCIKHPFFKTMLKGSYQEAFEWQCPISGLNRYSRPDVVIREKKKIIIDIKTEGGDDFEKSMVKFDYWLQAFDQMTGAVESGALDVVDEYYFFVISKKAPYFVDVYQLQLDQLLKVEEVYQSTLSRLSQDLGNLESIVWHKRPIELIKVPNYYK